MNQKRILSIMCILVIIFSYTVAGNSQTNDKPDIISDEKCIIDKLKSLAKIKIKSFDLEFFIEQPLDHQNPDGEKFLQRIMLSHVDVSKPVVFIPEGYSLRSNAIKELRSILDANQIRVEHRFFGESLPDSMNWDYLRVKQAAADHHRIVTLFKEIYKGKWISAGWSKGGQTALFHRQFYPGDVDATVAYDAPITMGVEDPRIDRFFETVGAESCREKLIKFQRMVLKNKNALLPEFKENTEKKGYTYSIGLEKAFEFIVLEYPFSFWQYHHIDCQKIPGKESSINEMFNHLNEVVSFSSYSDDALNSSSMYQNSTEIGYYRYVNKNVKDLLKFPDHKNTDFAPQNTELVYKPEIMKNLSNWLQTEGNNIIYIYASHDPWSAPAIESVGNTNALKLTLDGGNHYTFINNFPDNEREKILDKLEEWLNIKIKR